MDPDVLDREEADLLENYDATHMWKLIDENLRLELKLPDIKEITTDLNICWGFFCDSIVVHHCMVAHDIDSKIVADLKSVISTMTSNRVGAACLRILHYAKSQKMLFVEAFCGSLEDWLNKRELHNRSVWRLDCDELILSVGFDHVRNSKLAKNIIRCPTAFLMCFLSLGKKVNKLLESVFITTSGEVKLFPLWGLESVHEKAMVKYPNLNEVLNLISEIVSGSRDIHVRNIRSDRARIRLPETGNSTKALQHLYCFFSEFDHTRHNSQIFFDHPFFRYWSQSESLMHRAYQTNCLKNQIMKSVSDEQPIGENWAHSGVPGDVFYPLWEKCRCFLYAWKNYEDSRFDPVKTHGFFDFSENYWRHVVRDFIAMQDALRTWLEDEGILVSTSKKPEVTYEFQCAVRHVDEHDLAVGSFFAVGKWEIVQLIAAADGKEIRNKKWKIDSAELSSDDIVKLLGMNIEDMHARDVYKWVEDEIDPSGLSHAAINNAIGSEDGSTRENKDVLIQAFKQPRPLGF